MLQGLARGSTPRPAHPLRRHTNNTLQAYYCRPPSLAISRPLAPTTPATLPYQTIPAPSNSCLPFLSSGFPSGALPQPAFAHPCRAEAAFHQRCTAFISRVTGFNPRPTIDHNHPAATPLASRQEESPGGRADSCTQPRVGFEAAAGEGEKEGGGNRCCNHHG